MKPYGPLFAQVYDRHWADYALKSAPLLLNYLGRKLPQNHAYRLLDLGCGTGQLALTFLQAGWNVTGLDLSEDMMGFATLKAAPYLVSGQAAFTLGDMADFSFEQPFDAVVATYNTMNHLVWDAMASCIRSVHRNLSRKGLALLDMNTSKGLQEWADSETIKTGEISFDLKGSYDEKTGRAEVNISGDFGGEFLDAVLVNYSFPLARVEAVCRSLGFASFHWALPSELDRPLSDPENESRVFLVAEKA
jgi:SAM-dependent methyltransferase